MNRRTLLQRLLAGAAAIVGAGLVAPSVARGAGVLLHPDDVERLFSTASRDAYVRKWDADGVTFAAPTVTGNTTLGSLTITGNTPLTIAEPATLGWNVMNRTISYRGSDDRWHDVHLSERPKILTIGTVGPITSGGRVVRSWITAGRTPATSGWSSEELAAISQAYHGMAARGDYYNCADLQSLLSRDFSPAPPTFDALQADQDAIAQRWDRIEAARAESRQALGLPLSREPA